MGEDADEDEDEAMVFDVGVDNWSFGDFFGIPNDLLPLPPPPGDASQPIPLADVAEEHVAEAISPSSAS
eukprot:789169-Amphidinium_carterae.1